MIEKIDIPEELIQVCRDMAKVARQHGLTECSGKFKPAGGWNGEVGFSWEAGRHGEDGDQIKVYSNFFLHTKVSGKV